jgi:hypothetical protein
MDVNKPIAILMIEVSGLIFLLVILINKV